MKKTIDAELLISLIENRPVIWDKTLETYKDKNLRNAAWREICTALKEDFEEMDEKKRQDYAKTVVTKWNQIRDSWIRSLKEKMNAKKSGSAAVNVRKYVYHNQLLFLKKYVRTPVTFENTNNKETCDKMNQDDTAVEKGELEASGNQNEKSEHETSIINESPRQDSVDGAKRSNRSNKPKIKNQHNSQNEDRNLLFLKSLLPSLALLDDDQTLEFQAGVISLLQNIKRRKYGILNNYPLPQYAPQYLVQTSLSNTSMSDSEMRGIRRSSAESSNSGGSEK